MFQATISDWEESSTNPEHEAIISYLFKRFDLPNNGVDVDPPIEVYGQSYHFNPTGYGDKIAPNVAICPSEVHVPQPSIPQPGPPPSNVNEKRCENWMHERYIRCVFGIKLGKKISHQDQVHRSMITKLWTRQALAGSVLSTNLTLAGAGVHVKTWDFGTLLYGTFTPTNCISANLPAYQVTIPVLDIFWNPPIMNGVVNEVNYIPTVPHETCPACNEEYKEDDVKGW
ncbi:hypothetical protein C2G38_2196716 [Gigaspora rosea]|uniref:Uncharacterized protein n=1 Tax=Gigaspora rosea TaxID=44941 RepID=A0A397UUD7_9GLOM|nr:hypothetical protein C2G38_2196716 [Gigaspora rosea]